MRKYIGLLIVAIIITFANVSCDKKKKITPIDTDVKKYFSYKPGTYWIYRDSLTGQVDSFAVTRNYTVVQSSNSVNDYSVETIVIEIYKNGIQESIGCSYGLKQNMVNFDYNDYNDINFAPLFFYPFMQTGIYSYPDGSSYSLELLTSYYLNGNGYSNVIKLVYRNNIFYINNDVGIIKFRLNDSHAKNIWELLNNHTVH